jgi:hypothetical protein
MTRWDVERAVLGSDLTRTERLILLALLTYVDVATAMTPAAHTPSLTRLAGQCLLDRSHLARHLSRLEVKGWLQRQRPPVEQSRRGVRTRYRLVAPTPLANAGPSGRRATTGSGPRATKVVAPRPPRSEPKPIPDQERADLALVAETLELATGKKKISDEDARRAIELAVNGRAVRDPYRYAVKVIRDDANPRRFLPTPMPPPVREVLPATPQQATPPGEAGRGARKEHHDGNH